MNEKDRASDIESMVNAALSRIDPKARALLKEKKRLLQKHRTERKARNKEARRQRKTNRKR